MSEAANRMTKPPLRGGHFLTMLTGFFAVIFAVDGFMIYRAVTTFGGVETDDAYRKGVAYNESIAKDAQQTLSGWTDDVRVLPAPRRLQVSLRDKAGNAIARRRVVALVGRPATNRFDSTVALSETSDGIYEGALSGFAEGTWVVDVSAYDGDGHTEPVYQARKRIWIAP